MAILGVLFDIDELGGDAYGYRAYEVLFSVLGRERLLRCHLSDGDTSATLVGRANDYCIAIECSDQEHLSALRHLLGVSHAQGLAPPEDRFLDGRRVGREPLVTSAYIEGTGELSRCESPWVMQAWEEAGQDSGAASPDTIDQEWAESPTVSSADSVAGRVETEPGHLAREGERITPPPGRQEQAAPTSATPPKPASTSPAVTIPKRHAPRPEHRIGEVMGSRYRVLDVRRGGMGLVYIVEDVESLERDIFLRLALKTFQDRFLWEREVVGRFEREAMNWIELGRHPHIVHAMFVEQIEGRPYLWLEFVPGESLADRLERGPLDLTDFFDFSLQFVRGMRYATEENGLIHRDIKPGNVLVSDETVIKITDFGLSRLRGELAACAEGEDPSPVGRSLSEAQATAFATKRGLRVGTPAYMPPEVILEASNVDTRGDIYSYGVMAYQMATGHLPFWGADVLQQHVTATPRPASELVPGIPTALDDLIGKCIEKNPRDRFDSFAQVEEALESLGQQLSDSPRRFEQREFPEPKEVTRFAAFSKAVSLMAFERYGEAAMGLQEAVAINPSDPELHSNLAVCLGHLGRTHEALPHAEEAVELGPNQAVAWSNLAAVYSRLGEHLKGIEACKRSLALDPGWAEAHANLGVILVSLGRLEDGMEAFDRACRADESYWKVHVMAAEALAQHGSPAENILPLLEKARAKKPRDARILAFMAGCLDDLERPDEALHCLDLAREIDADEPLTTRVSEIIERRHGRA